MNIPRELLRKLSKVAIAKGISESRLILLACERALENDTGKWPEGFFSQSHKDKDLSRLRRDAIEMEDAVLSKRENRGRVIPCV